MPKIVTVAEMRAIEAATDATGTSYAAMMDRAGRAVADLVIAKLADLPDALVLVLVGPGNNGGDGLVAGRLIAEESDAEVAFYLLKPRAADDANFAKVEQAGLSCTKADTDPDGDTLRALLTNADVIVDALLGTGARLPVKGKMAALLNEAGRVISTRRKAPPKNSTTYRTPAAPRAADTVSLPIVIAVDCPSGLDCDTGAADPLTLNADDTITFAAVKVGHVSFPGAAKLGRLHVADIGTPPDLAELTAINTEMSDGPAVRVLLPHRPVDGHKGTFGKALLIAGSLNYVGAPALAALAAYRAGTGWVTVGAPGPVVSLLAPQVTEATWLLLPHDMGVLAEKAADIVRKEMSAYSAMLLGPGWGQEKTTGIFLQELLRPDVVESKRAIGFVHNETDADPADTDVDLPPLVIDADGLNLLAGMEDWPSALPAGSILTPHPGEMARLCGVAPDALPSDRIELARARAAAWDCVVVLKGAHTVVAAADGRVRVMPFASSALATAGTGDVLAGTIVALRAQGLPPFDAAAAGAYLHGLAGEMSAGLLGTPASVVASDVGDMLPEALALVSEAVT